MSSSPCINSQCDINHIRYQQGLLSRSVYFCSRSTLQGLDLFQFSFLLCTSAHPSAHTAYALVFLITRIFMYMLVRFTCCFYRLHFLAFLVVLLAIHGGHLIFFLHIYVRYFVAVLKLYKGSDIYVCICLKNLCYINFVVSSKVKELICHIYLYYLFPNEV